MKAKYVFSKAIWDEMTIDERQCQHGNVDLGWWVRRDPSDFAFMLAHYADAHFDSGLLLLNTFLAQRIYGDSEALPVLFAFGHFTELGLKACHEYKRLALKQSAGTVVERHQAHHRLSDLLRELELLFGDSESCLSRDTRDFIKLLNDFNLEHAFRYPYDKKGKPAWADTPPVPMLIFKRQVEKHCREIQDLYYKLSEEYSRSLNKD